MRLFAPLRRRPVALLWAGLSLSAIGDQLYAVALTWVATSLLGGAAGYLGALQSLTILLVVLFTGSLADRIDPLRAMLGADLLRAGMLALLTLLWLATGAPSAAALALTVMVLAVGQAVFQPALQSALPALVADARLLPAANGLFDGTDRSARLLGPGLLALLSGIVPLVHFMTLNAVSFLVSAACLLAIRRSQPAREARAAAPARLGLAGIRRGIAATRAHPLLGYVLATAGPLNGSWYAVFFLGLPLLLRQQDVQGLGSYGLIISAYGATNLLSNIVVGSREMPARPQFQMFSGSMLVGVGMAAFALVGGLPGDWRLPAYVALAMLCGLAGPMKDIPLAVMRQTFLPAADISAAARAMLAAGQAGVLVVMAAMPLLLQHLPVALVVAGCGGIAFAVGAIGLLRHAAWREEIP